MTRQERLSFYIQTLTEYSCGGLCAYFQNRGIISWEKELPELALKISVEFGRNRFENRAERLQALQMCIVEITEQMLIEKLLENKPN